MMQIPLIIWLSIFSTFAQIKPEEWENESAQRILAQLQARVDDPLVKLATMQEKLLEAHKQAELDTTAADLVAKALSRIDLARGAAQSDPAGAEAQAAFQAAWFMTKAAYIQTMVAESRANEREFKVDIDAVLKRMDAVKDSIKLYRPQGLQAAQAIAALFESNSTAVRVNSDERGTVVSLADILFEVGQAGLSENLKAHLKRIAEILTTSTQSSIVIEGHTDNTGSSQANTSLSQERAKAVREYLVSAGVPAARIQSQGLGASRPVASNDTEDGRKKNRRVDLVIK